MQRVDKLETTVNENGHQLKELNQRIDRLTEVVTRLGYELLRDRENAEREREIQRLQLENALLRFQQGLPPVAGNELPE